MIYHRGPIKFLVFIIIIIIIPVFFLIEFLHHLFLESGVSGAAVIGNILVIGPRVQKLVFIIRAEAIVLTGGQSEATHTRAEVIILVITVATVVSLVIIIIL